MVPYCGAFPVPGELLYRWNLDPGLLLALSALAFIQIGNSFGSRRVAATFGWAIATLAFISPLCALSVALFSARVGQHMILLLVAAPLIGVALPQGRWRQSIWWSVAAFTAALWVWHMPAPYDATFHSDAVYWAMHVTLFGTAIWLWRDLLNHKPGEALIVVAAGLFACVQMGLLGAILSLSAYPWFDWYATTTSTWGLSQLEDQQLGGILMWLPSGVIFLIAASRSLLIANKWLEQTG